MGQVTQSTCYTWWQFLDGLTRGNDGRGWLEAGLKAHREDRQGLCKIGGGKRGTEITRQTEL